MTKKNQRSYLYDAQKSFGMLLRQLRNDKKLEQQEVADFLGVKRVTISAYERGRIKPTADKIYKLSQLFGVSTDVMSGKIAVDNNSGSSNKMNEMLYYYNNLSEIQQKAILDFAKMLKDG